MCVHKAKARQKLGARRQNCCGWPGLGICVGRIGPYGGVRQTLRCKETASYILSSLPSDALPLFLSGTGSGPGCTRHASAKAYWPLDVSAGHLCSPFSTAMDDAWQGLKWQKTDRPTSRNAYFHKNSSCPPPPSLPPYPKNSSSIKDHLIRYCKSRRIVVVSFSRVRH